MTTKAPSTVPGHEQSLAHHKEVLSRMAALLKPLGFRRKGVSFWKAVDSGSRFAGFVASITPRRGTKKVELQVVTMGVAVDDMLDRQSLLDSIENEVRRGRIYIRAKDFERTPEIIARLRSAC